MTERVAAACSRAGSAAGRAWFFILSVVRDPHDGSFSAVNIGALVAMWALTRGFLAEVATREVDWLTFLGYAAAMVVASGAPLAERVLSTLAPRIGGNVAGPKP